MFEHDDLILCRLCRGSSGLFLDIYNPKGTRGLIVWKVIKDLLQLDVNKDDPLPNTICEECMERVVDFRNFKAMCINSRIEFLKESVNIGLVEAEVEECPKKALPEVAVLACDVVDPPSGQNSNLSRDPLDLELGRLDAKGSQEPAKRESLSISCEADNLAGKYIQPRLDEGIGSLKPCDAPNCRKVFSTYKALVIHKRAKHPNLEDIKVAEKAANQMIGSSGKGGDAQSRDPTFALKGDASIHIGEFCCEQPSCLMKFSNLSSLLSHQATHQLAEDDSRLGPPLDNGRGNDVGILEATVESSSPNQSDDDYEVELLIDDLPSNHEEPCGPNPGTVPVVETSGSSQSGSVSKYHPDNSIPVELEFLCHWPGCKMAFDSFDTLLQHKKQNHSIGAGGAEQGSMPKKPKRRGTERELKNLTIDMTAQRESRRRQPKSVPANGKRDGALKASGKTQTDSSKKKDEGKSAQSIDSTREPVKCPTTYLCAWPNCLQVFNSIQGLHSHQFNNQHGRGMNRSSMDASPTSGSDSTHREHSKPSDDSKNPAKVGSKNARKSSANKRDSTGKVRVKAEPTTGTGNGLLNRSRIENFVMGPEDFECEYPNCRRIFNTFKSLQSHYRQVHVYTQVD